ncbi:MAG: 16S rRNA (cytidine(1402)-2'-O)-methyltransferase [Armatimonadetes bacterium]|nr:16S rRNA (cytidine(1402)-2'-O)-methyltransferase [Armatimonadota bacterium]
MADPSSSRAGTLYIVATPIGNLEDLTARARRVLAEVDVIAAEDTRRTRGLLEHLGLDRPVESCHEHSERGKASRIITRILEGRSVAYVTDAGVPTISDPGSVLVAEALAAGISVRPVPGPSAVTAALSVSGFRADQYLFAGYPPRKQSERARFFADIRDAQVPVVVFEAPHRIRECLRDAREALGLDREVFVGREMTKHFEEYIRAPLGQLCDRFTRQEPLGEFTLVFSPSGKQHNDAAQPGDPNRVADLLAATNLSTRQATEILAAASGMGRNAAYQAILARRSG